MHYKEIQEEFPRRQGPPRSPGLHLTDIIVDIVKPKTSDNDLFKEPGFIWEELLSFAFGQSLADRPGEIVVDGIAMSPDGMDWENWVVHEYKVTWRSTNKLPVDNAYWMMQLKGYCKGLGATAAKMRILYLMGNYRGSGPQYTVWEMQFSKLEIDENWEAIVNHAKFRGWL